MSYTLDLWQNIAITTNAIVVSLGLWFVWRQIKAHRTSNMLSSFVDIEKRWYSKEMLVARRMVCVEFIEITNNIEKEQIESRLRECVLDHFEWLGLYLKKKIFEVGDVWDKYCEEIEIYWRMLESDVKGMRSESKDNTYYERFEDLFYAMLDYTNKKDIEHTEFTTPTLKDSAESQIELVDEMLNISDMYRYCVSKKRKPSYLLSPEPTPEAVIALPINYNPDKNQ